MDSLDAQAPSAPAAAERPTPAAAGDQRAAWVLAAVATVALAVVLGTFGSIGVLIDPLAGEFGAGRAQLVPLFPAGLAVHSLAAPLAGAAADRLGPRLLLSVSAAAMAGGLLAPATADRLELAIAGYGLGLGVASAATWVATTLVVSASFDRRRSAALGMLAAGPAAGGALLAPAVAALTEARGPRFACVALAALGTVTCAVAGALLPRRAGAGAPAAEPAPSTGGRRPAVHRFYAATLVTSMVVFLPVLHIAGDAVDRGLSPGQGAALLAAVSAASAVTRLGAGWLATGPRLPRMYCASHVLMAAGFAVWAVAGPGGALPMLLAVAVLFGAGYGGWLSLGPAVLAAVCPRGHLGRALGTLAAVVGIGGVIGPLLSAPLLPTARTEVLAAGAVLALAAALVLLPDAAGSPRGRAGDPPVAGARELSVTAAPRQTRTGKEGAPCPSRRPRRSSLPVASG